MPFSADIFFRTFEGGTGGFQYPVVLLHGAGSTHLGWPWQLRRIPGLNICAIDLPAHGNSNSACCRSLDELTGYLKSFFNRMGWYQVILVGHSLGGAAALTFAAAYPELVRGLILLGCCAAFQIPSELLDLLRPPAKLERAVHFISNTAFSNAFPHVERMRVTAPMLKLRPSTLLSDLMLCDRFRLPDRMAKFDKPALLIGGIKDAYAPPTALRRLQNALPNAQVYMLPDASHMMMFERTEVVLNRMRDFLYETRIAELVL
jgi:pimeloyl-ACP methyl ester carboxylesterase